MTECLECDGPIKIPKDAIEGEIVVCGDCGSSFELLKTETDFDIKPTQSVEEDWGQ